MNEWRHSIRDITIEMDDNRMAVKDLMLEVALTWSNAIPKESVV